MDRNPEAPGKARERIKDGFLESLRFGDGGSMGDHFPIRVSDELSMGLGGWALALTSH